MDLYSECSNKRVCTMRIVHKQEAADSDASVEQQENAHDEQIKGRLTFGGKARLQGLKREYESGEAAAHSHCNERQT
jgi:hypothetical protein